MRYFKFQAMIKNYFKTAFRSLLNNKFYTGINIIGLAVGLATCLMILLYVLDELNYDKFNTKADRIYRLNNEIRFIIANAVITFAMLAIGRSLSLSEELARTPSSTLPIAA